MRALGVEKPSSLGPSRLTKIMNRAVIVPADAEELENLKSRFCRFASFSKVERWAYIYSPRLSPTQFFRLKK
jgi:hypothetical protein